MSHFKAKIQKNSISAGAPPQTPLGELTALSRGPSESFAVVCTLVHCNCFVSIFFAMPIQDIFALDVRKSDSSILAMNSITYKQWRRSLWDRGDVSPQYLLWGDMPINVPPNIWEFLFLKHQYLAAT